MQCVMRTFTGKDINPVNLRIQDVDIFDIAHALSLCNRFAGHTQFPISVAQHSWYVSRLCEGTGYELQGLLHDASEAYLGDMTKWLKQTEIMSGYRHVENFVQAIIYKKFNTPSIMSGPVQRADCMMAVFEGVKGFGDSFTIDHPRYPPLSTEELHMVNNIQFWTPWTPKVAEDIFLDRFSFLTTEKH